MQGLPSPEVGLIDEARRLVRDPERLSAVRWTGLLDTPPEEAFDLLTRLAAKVLDAPCALISLVDEERQFLKSCFGPPEPWSSQRERPLAESFSQYALALGDALMIEDARSHPLVRDHPGAHELGIGAYLGMPLLTSQGHGVGTFCVFDPRPRAWTQDQVQTLRDLAAAAMTEIELRVAIRQAREQGQAAARERREKLVLLESLEQELRRRERREERQRFLARAAGELAASLDYETTLRKVTRLAVPMLADWVVVDLLTPEGSIQQVAVAHADPAQEPLIRELRARYPPDPDEPHVIWRVLRTGESDLVAEAAGSQLAVPADEPGLFRILKELGTKSHMVVALRLRGRILGAMSFVSGGFHGYGAEELALAEDLARRAAMAIENARLYRQVQDSLRARDEFLGSVSHDLKTPLTAIKSHVQLLARRAAKGTLDERRLEEALASIVPATTHMTALINDLLDITRLRLGQPLRLEAAPMDLVALAQQVAAQHQETTNAHRIRVEASLPELVGLWDAPRIERVLGNLLSNAIRYSPRGGDIMVTVEQERPAGEEPGDEWAVLRVADHGLGIPASDLPRIFERFHRGSNVVGRIGGVGIGLTSSRQIVEQHGGTIDVLSQEGRGSTFTVRLPVSTISTEKHGAHPEEPGPHRREPGPHRREPARYTG